MSFLATQWFSTKNYTKLSYYCRWKINVEIINVGHSNWLVRVDIMWAQHPGSFPGGF